MPGIKRECLVERHRFAVFGMHEFALPISGLERAEQGDPAFVQGVEKIERWADWGFSVGEFGPTRFEIRLDGGNVLGESELETHEGVHVAIGNVVDRLANGPTARTVGRIKLL